MKNQNVGQTEFIPGISALLPDDMELFLQQISPLKIVLTEFDQSRVRQFLNRKYEQYFCDLAHDDNDPYLYNSITAYSEDAQGKVISTASIALGTDGVLPEEHLFHDSAEAYRMLGESPVQIGRFIIDSNACKNHLKWYMKLFYLYPMSIGRKVVFGLVKDKDVSLHETKFGAKILVRDTQITYGGQHNFAVAMWPLEKLNHRYYRFIGLNPGNDKAYTRQDWDSYAKVFASVQTQVQRELQQSAITHLKGDVVDLGCGAAKIGALLSDRQDVSSYLGIDASKDMIEVANWYLAQFQTSMPLTTWRGCIEDYDREQLFDSAVSLNSYYSWNQPVQVLSRIHALLKPGAVFVIANPNPRLDLLALDQQERKELILHPDYAAFREHNLKLVGQRDGNFPEMDELVSQLMEVGFKLQSCHSKFYAGGLNYVVVRK